MNLKQQIDNDIKEAMRAKDKDSLKALRAIKSLILLEETKEGREPGDLKEDEEIKLLSKAAKQRRDSAEIYKEQSREDLAENELTELAVIEKYLPKQLGEDELRETLKEIITEVGASTPKDMGKVMGVATKKLVGKADGKMISKVVKELLSQG